MGFITLAFTQVCSPLLAGVKLMGSKGNSLDIGYFSRLVLPV